LQQAAAKEQQMLQQIGLTMMLNNQVPDIHAVLHALQAYQAA
jgi:hypothetical protein